MCVSTNEAWPEPVQFSAAAQLASPLCGMLRRHPRLIAAFFAPTRTHGLRKEHRGAAAGGTVRVQLGPSHVGVRDGSCGISYFGSPDHLASCHPIAAGSLPIPVVQCKPAARTACGRLRGEAFYILIVTLPR